MKTQTLTKPQYTKLVKDIRVLIDGGKQRAKEAVANELVVTYWEIGKRITEEGLTQNAGYSGAVLGDLAEELTIDETTLIRSIQFFQQNATAPRSSNLTWSHYKYLIPIAFDKERAWYLELAQEENLTRDQLASAIKRDAFNERGKTGDGKGVKRQTVRRPTEPTYLYKAYVTRVIDGDTLLLRIDLGFTVFKEQRIRLAGIDTSKKETPAGEKAYRFVLNTLAKVPFVMVKTNKIDIYGRYVGDVFYLEGEADKNKIFLEGKHLNQEILSKRLARII